MPKSPKQKQKLLYIIQLLMDKTDETHTVTTPDIIAYLKRNDIEAERKSIYDDIETLKDYGYDILREGGPRGGYKLIGREFELAEVKLLVDLVQSSKFITEKKSRELIHKLEGLVSQNQASALSRQVVVAERNKAANENIYYSVDVIHEAMAHNKKVRYHYFEWDEHKQARLRKDGAFYEVSPWLLTWEDENYYLIAFDDEASMLKYYRVDKMLHIQEAEEERQGHDVFERVDIASLQKKTFGMFAGEERTVQLSCDKGAAGILIDRFGTGLAIRELDENRAIARADVQVSPQFFGWLAGLGGRVRIEGPTEIADEYRKYLQKLLQSAQQG